MSKICLAEYSHQRIPPEQSGGRTVSVPFESMSGFDSNESVCKL